ncbi:DUF3310 domain-containing protein [Stutzerimonas stutzeri]|uniref:DUF3310 domain-containing protein n=1 Tax=Stutzerimonas stutzeri TaxID=316 RepID=UPI00210D2E49|nr:DUF3310 domain-containing protein [Stutzerimonas stutzeri]MCQ4257448.1 DUF3310 domain-containing protein [Stutzerimonas stutzeri]
MSIFTLTKGSSTALGYLARRAGTEQLLLTQPARELRAEINIEPSGLADRSGGQVHAVLWLREQRHSITLQRDDSANAQHLTEWVEAIANGTLETAAGIPQRPAPAELSPCCKCGSEAIAYDYAGPGDVFLNGVKCRHGDCQSLEGAPTPAIARDAWNEIQLEHLNEQPATGTDMVNHPPHYTGHPSGVECIEVAEHLPFCLGNAFKYLYLRNACGSVVENIEQAIWHVNRHNETYPDKPALPEEAREALGEIVVHEPHPFGACMLIIAGPAQCGAYDTCLEMLKSEAERLRWIAQHDAAAA